MFFQPLWTEHADGDADGSSDASRLTDQIMDAVAARFEMGVPKNVKLVAVYPAYVVVRGPSQDVSVPHIIHQPNWLDVLFPHGSSIRASAAWSICRGCHRIRVKSTSKTPSQ